ncbi:tRNA-dihydrouridine(16 17) synthase [NAD(P)(+)] [Lecanosticta acicola]|uniref:tRNA-dihydrouridine(16/17) synthase [NAD(P)(+)] n=1 Tax=Lecanosticta acicola TaxID=111012 RepID=A0AAI9E770_9PEZI|nr:tRNA-dihydrouridine(16 17) synthase [NAD(P)(+)] [Lecanosticta acicola]
MAPEKLHGRAFYESIGSPKYVVAPMVDQSEFAWRLLTRSFLPPELRTTILAYSPMFHAKLFAEAPKYRAAHFEPLKPPLVIPPSGDVQHQNLFGEEDAYLDGNPKIDRPLFVQFCANEPDMLLEAAKLVQPFCDAVDLNLGCPQGIARRGHYGAFLQEDWDTIYKLINTLHKGLDIPVTAKMRVLETKERTLDYAKMILSAGASIITVHGRQREQKGHNTGLADWTKIRYLREQLPPETVIFANGNILRYDDLQKSLDATKADAIMSAEGNLYDPSIFAPAPPVGQEGREYWRGRDGKGGYRADAVLRRYLNIIHKHVLGQDPPEREPLFLPTDPRPETDSAKIETQCTETEEDQGEDGPPKKKQKREGSEKEKKEKRNGKQEKCTNPNLVAMQAHCFHILRSLVSTHHGVRDALAKSRVGDIDAYENVLKLTQEAVKEGLLDYEKDPSKYEYPDPQEGEEEADPELYSTAAVRRCKRPYWICQPHIRPLPKEAIEKGSLQLSKKVKARLQAEKDEKEKAGLPADGKVEVVKTADKHANNGAEERVEAEIPKEGVICG